MTVKNLLANISAEELTEWQLIFRLKNQEAERKRGQNQ